MTEKGNRYIRGVITEVAKIKFNRTSKKSYRLIYIISIILYYFLLEYTILEQKA